MAVSTVLAYGIAYFFCSSTMLLANKLAIHSIPAPALICTLQYAFSAFIVLIVSNLGLVEADKFSIELIKKYWKVPALFSAAIFANNKILEYSNIETFLVVRFTTPLLVSVVDFLLMGKSLPSTRNVGAFILIIFGASVYVWTDSEEGFQIKSYSWAAFYLFVICVEMIYVKHIFNSVDMTVWGRVLYTNTLSLPFQPFFIVTTMEYAKYSDMTWTVEGIGFILLSCVGGFGISFAGTGFRACVSATTFTLVGVTNKIISVTVNYLMWDQHATNLGLAALALCLLGSTLYRPAGKREIGSTSDNVWNTINNVLGGALQQHKLEGTDQTATEKVKYTELSTKETTEDNTTTLEKEDNDTDKSGVQNV